MSDETESGTAAAGRGISALLPCWVRCQERLPPKGCAVLVDGMEWPTFMVARYVPTDPEFPWVVNSGFEEERFSPDAFDVWQDLPTGPAR